MTRTPSTTERQAPTALLALVQHINDHELGSPLTIHAPCAAAPYFQVAIVSTALDAWIASGLAVTATTTEARDGRIAGRRWERIQVDGTLAPHGIRVQLVTHRPLPGYVSPMHLAGVPA